MLVGWYAEESAKRDRKVSNHILYILKKAVQIIVYIFAFLAILGVLEVDLSGVVVGLGVGVTVGVVGCRVARGCVAVGEGVQVGEGV